MVGKCCIMCAQQASFQYTFVISEFNSFQEDKGLSYIFSHNNYLAVNCVTTLKFMINKRVVFFLDRCTCPLTCMCLAGSVLTVCSSAIPEGNELLLLLSSENSSQNCSRWFLSKAGALLGHALLENAPCHWWLARGKSTCLVQCVFPADLAWCCWHLWLSWSAAC